LDKMIVEEFKIHLVSNVALTSFENMGASSVEGVKP
jgi:hypothetical protein